MGIFQLMERHVLMTRGTFTTRHYKDMEMMYSHYEGNFHFISRMPNVLERFYGFLLPFSLSIWVTTIFSLLCLSIMFYITYSAYTIPEMSHAGLHIKETSSLNFFLYTLSKLTEPDPLPWFTSQWSTGKLLTFIWSLYCLLMTSFYNCNLRAHLAAVDYEKPVDNANDVIQQGKTPWLVAEVTAMQ